MLAPAFLGYSVNGGKLGKSWMLILKQGVVVRMKLSDSWGTRGCRHDNDDGTFQCLFLVGAPPPPPPPPPCHPHYTP